MKTNQIALQLYTLRDQLDTPENIRRGLQKVAAIGYQAVQSNGFASISDDELLAILAGEGLQLCATHEDSETLQLRPEAASEHLHKLGCRHTAYAYPVGVDLTDPAQVAQLARQLDHAGEVLHRAGQTLSYHNHALEFCRMAGGETVLEYLYAHTDPRFLQAELDTYWVQYGGGNPADWCRRMAGRLPLLHCKDYEFTAQDKPRMAEIGSGNLDWQKIIAAAEASGCPWFIVEQDTCPGDPFDSVKKSFDYLKGLCV